MDIAQIAAEKQGVPLVLVIVLLLQESQWYHGTCTERFWTEIFLWARDLPVQKFQAKSLGVASIKPVTAQKLLATRGVVVSLEGAAQIVAREHATSIELATSLLGSFLACGASPEGAFLAYAASATTAAQVIDDLDQVAREKPRFEIRLRDYWSGSGKSLLAGSISSPSQRRILAELMTPHTVSNRRSRSQAARSRLLAPQDPIPMPPRVPTTAIRADASMVDWPSVADVPVHDLARQFIRESKGWWPPFIVLVEGRINSVELYGRHGEDAH